MWLIDFIFLIHIFNRCMIILFSPNLKKTNYAIVVVIKTWQDLHQFILRVSKLTVSSGIEKIKEWLYLAEKIKGLFIMGERK